MRNIFYFSIILLFLFTSCHSDDEAISSFEVNLSSNNIDTPIPKKDQKSSDTNKGIPDKKEVANRISFPSDTSSDGNTIDCTSWTVPVVQPGDTGITFEVEYNSIIVAPEDIPCIRKEYFDQFCSLRLLSIDPGNIYRETWLIRNAGSIDSSCSIETTQGANATQNSAATKTSTDPRVSH